MTENEAIEVMKTEMACVTRNIKNECNKDCYSCDLLKEDSDILSGYDMAISALEEIQQYRALGTVEELKSKIEELKRWHTNHTNEGIKNVFANTSTLICHNCDHKDEYIMELEAEVEELREAREKQKPKKPLLRLCGDCKKDCDDCDRYEDRCPNCNGSLYVECGKQHKYCPKCGQAIDWSEEE